VGSARIAPGDTVQFGAGGPEFQFDLDPRPEQYLRSTRIAGDGTTAAYGSMPMAAPPTRIGGGPAQMTPSTPMGPMGSMGSGPGPTMPAHGTVGKATVERMISQNKSDSRKLLIFGGLALFLVI